MSYENLDDLLKKINRLEPVPVVAAKLSSIVGSPKSTLDDIVSVIMYDPVLVANILRWANSALWAQKKPIVIVRDAVIRLGAGRILQIIVGKHVKPSMEKNIPEYGLNSGELWRHAVASALAAEELNRYISIDLPSETFTAVLLHDIGKIVLRQLINPEKLNAILEKSNSNGMTYIEAEQEIWEFLTRKSDAG